MFYYICIAVVPREENSSKIHTKCIV